MNIGEELDKLAEEGRVSSFQVIGTGKRWQCYLNMPGTGSQVARSATTPGAALQAALELLPTNEAYDKQFGASAVTARAIAENKPIVAFDLEDIPVEPEPAGVFD